MAIALTFVGWVEVKEPGSHRVPQRFRESGQHSAFSHWDLGKQRYTISPSRGYRFNTWQAVSGQYQRICSAML